MIQAGARPMTALTYLLELQRDWARLETYDLTTGIAMKFGGAFGIGVKYVKTMFDAHESQSHKQFQDPALTKAQHHRPPGIG
jgi:hypothetical protein